MKNADKMGVVFKFAPEIQHKQLIKNSLLETKVDMLTFTIKHCHDFTITKCHGAGVTVGKCMRMEMLFFFFFVVGFFFFFFFCLVLFFAI